MQIPKRRVEKGHGELLWQENITSVSFIYLLYQIH